LYLHGFGLQAQVFFYKVNLVDPELRTPSGLYVYVWIYGVHINGNLILQFCVKFLFPGVRLTRYAKALSY